MGAPQWTVPIWKGETYPAGTRPVEFLDAYARQWNAIELNSSFYASPTAEQVAEWAARTPADFRFFTKVHRDLSHDRELYANGPSLLAKIRDYHATWVALGSRWGGSFLQLPPGFARSDFPALRYWIDAWRLCVENSERFPAPFEFAIEFRHESWFRDRRLLPEIEDFLVERGIGAVCTDTPGRRDASHSSLTTDFWLIRFLAQSTIERDAVLPGDLTRIEAWARRLAELTKRGLRGFAFFPHTPEHRWVPELSRQFISHYFGHLGEEAGVAGNLRGPRVIPQEPEISQLGFPFHGG